MILEILIEIHNTGSRKDMLELHDVLQAKVRDISHRKALGDIIHGDTEVWALMPKETRSKLVEAFKMVGGVLEPGTFY